jgi:hypothetical protein
MGFRENDNEPPRQKKKAFLNLMNDYLFLKAAVQLSSLKVTILRWLVTDLQTQQYLIFGTPVLTFVNQLQLMIQNYFSHKTSWTSSY